MKIYTGTGDGGRTSLFSGERLKKNDIQVEAYGTVDELCSFIGAIEAVLPESGHRTLLSKNLQSIQADLFAIGAILATASDSRDVGLLKPVEKARTEWLEQEIDAMQSQLEELHFFILPGGHVSAAWSQVARAVCRRAERKIITCADRDGHDRLENVVGYINRLSDYFFILARYLNKIAGCAETIWHE
jgi:cob(I)alamin adenosyltransferase